jgi:hypothetical protein
MMTLIRFAAYEIPGTERQRAEALRAWPGLTPALREEIARTAWALHSQAYESRERRRMLRYQPARTGYRLPEGQPIYRLPEFRRRRRTEPTIAMIRACGGAWQRAIDIRVELATRPGGEGIRLISEIQWDRPYKAGRHNWPSRRWTAIVVSLPASGELPEKTGDRRLRIGRWEYELASRSLSVRLRYLPGTEAEDRAALRAARGRDGWAGGNQERLRALLQACGPDRLGLEVQVVQADDFGRLLRVGDREPEASAAAGRITELGQVVEVRCPSTGRIYWLTVPRGIRTAREAVGATFRVPAGNYSPAYES